MALEFSINTLITATKEQIYNAWLDSEEHSEMTGGTATASVNVGDAFTSFDDYAWGKNIDLVPFWKIVQTWRTTSFAEDEENSIIEVLLEDEGSNTRLTLNHTNLPPHGTTYKQGWVDFYFTPMIAYFSK